MAINTDVVSYYKFNEASYDGTSGEVLDSTDGTPLDGVAAAGADTNASGKLNRCLFVDGVNQGTVVAHNILQNIANDFDYAISFWEKFAAVSSARRTVVHKWNAATDVGYYVDIAAGKVKTGVQQGGTYRIRESVVSTLSDGNWHHVLVVVSGNTVTDIDIYVDGALSNGATQTGGSTLDPSNTSDFEVGIASDTAFSNNFNGYIDDVVLYSSSKVAQDALDLHNGGAGQELVFDVTAPVIGAGEFLNTTSGAKGLITWDEPTETDLSEVEAEWSKNLLDWYRYTTTGTWNTSGDYMPFNAGENISTGKLPATNVAITSGIALGEFVTQRVRARDTTGNVSNWSVSTAVEVVNSVDNTFYADQITSVITTDKIVSEVRV